MTDIWESALFEIKIMLHKPVTHFTAGLVTGYMTVWMDGVLELYVWNKYKCRLQLN